MLKPTNISLPAKTSKRSFEWYLNSLSSHVFKYGNATHAFADILNFMNNGNCASQLQADQEEFPNIIMPSFIPAKLFRIILACGYTPRFYEIDKDCQFDMNEINGLISPGTKAIFVIHYFGYPAKVEMLRNLADEKNIYLIEDCAHVIYTTELDKRLGTWGDFSIFSPRKMLNLPEGGYLVLNRKLDNFKPTYTKRVNSLYTLSKLLQTRGKYYYLTLANGNDVFSVSKIPDRGYIDYARIQKSQIKNISRLTSFYSKHVNIRTHIEKRQQNYACLYNGIKDFSFFRPLYDDLSKTWTPYSFPVIVQNGYRNLLQMELIKAGISCGAGWPESPFDKRLKKTLALSQNLIEFPVHPFIKKSQLRKILDVCEKFSDLFKKNSSPLIQLENKPDNGNHSGEEVSISTSFNTEDSTVNYQYQKPQDKTVGEDIHAHENELSSYNVSIVVIKTAAEFDNLYAEWEELCEEADVHIFQTFEWQRFWWKYYGEGKQLNLILFYSIMQKNDWHSKSLKAKLVGIAPFFIDEKLIGGIKVLSRLRLIGCGVEKNQSEQCIPEYGVSDYLDIVVRRGYEREVSEALTVYLKEKYLQYDVIQLDEVRPDSAIFKYLLPLLKNSSHKITANKEICPRITLPGTIENYFNRLSSKVRNQLKKIRRDTLNQSLLKIKIAESGQELEKSFNEFVRLHQKRWNRVGLSGLFSDDKYEQFLKDVTNAFLAKGFLYFTSVYSKDDCIAAECAFKYKKYYYDYLKAFDDQSPLAKFRPGKALLLLLIEDAIGNKSEVVDLLRGSESYKFEFTSEWQWIYKVTIRNPVSGYGARYQFFLLMQFINRRKYAAVKEINIVAAHIKNYGFASLIDRYLPAAVKRIKNKLQSPLPRVSSGNLNESKQTCIDSTVKAKQTDKEAFGNNTEKIISPGKKKTASEGKKIPVDNFANGLGEYNESNGYGKNYI